MSDDLMTAEQAEQERLAILAAESIYKDVVQVEVLYRERWVRFEIPTLEIQHVTTVELWRRYLAQALSAVHAPAAVVADPVVPETQQVA